MLKYMAIGAILFIILMLNPVLLVCILGIWIVIIVVSHLKQNKQYSLLILSCIAIFIRIVTAAKIDTPIVSDFATYFKAAQLFAEGESFVEPGGYFSMWGYNTGIVILYGCLLKICNSALFLRIINSIFEGGTIIFVYLISFHAFKNRKGALFAATAFTFSPFNILYVTVLSNQQCSLFFIMVGLFVLWNDQIEDTVRFSVAGMLMGIANALRADVLPFVVSVIFCLLYGMISCKERRMYLLKNVLLFVVSYFGTNWVISEVIIISGINPLGTRYGNKVWKFAVGLNIDTRGMWSQADTDLLNQGMITWELLLQRIKGISVRQYLDLFIDKLRIFWLENPNGWSIGHWDNSKLKNYIYRLDAQYWGIVFFLGNIGMLKTMWQEKFNHFSQTFFPICMICTSCVFMIIEVQPRYRYSFSILFFIALASVYPDMENLLYSLSRKGEIDNDF